MDNIAELELDVVHLSREDLALLAGAAKSVLRHARFPTTVEGRLEKAKLEGAVDRAEKALGISVVLGINGS